MRKFPLLRLFWITFTAKFYLLSPTSCATQFVSARRISLFHSVSSMSAWHVLSHRRRSLDERIRKNSRSLLLLDAVSTFVWAANNLQVEENQADKKHWNWELKRLKTLFASFHKMILTMIPCSAFINLSTSPWVLSFAFSSLSLLRLFICYIIWRISELFFFSRIIPPELFFCLLLLFSFCLSAIVSPLYLSLCERFNEIQQLFRLHFAWNTQQKSLMTTMTITERWW